MEPSLSNSLREYVTISLKTITCNIHSQGLFYHEDEGAGSSYTLDLPTKQHGTTHQHTVI
jgi:hypothetical protein